MRSPSPWDVFFHQIKERERERAGEIEKERESEKKKVCHVFLLSLVGLGILGCIFLLIVHHKQKYSGFNDDVAHR